MPLRKCKCCGLEAHSQEELHLFKKSKGGKYGYANKCKICHNKETAYYESEDYKSLKVQEDKPQKNYLKKCNCCGLEIYKEEDLEKLTVNHNLSYGRNSMCKECQNRKTAEAKNNKTLKWLNEYDYLRKCNDCGTTAYKESSLNLFIINNDSPFGRRNTCTVCEAKRKGKPLSSKLVFYKRKCKCCGFEAHNEEELTHFVYDKNATFNRRNICNTCHRKEANTRNSLPHNKIKLSVKNRLRKVSTKTYFEHMELESLAIDELYSKCASLEDKLKIKLHIDHIYPLNNPLMCGLHTITNLEIVTEKYNLNKSNKLDPSFKGQNNLTDLWNKVSYRASEEVVFSLLGSNLSWEEYKEYERKEYERIEV